MFQLIKLNTDRYVIVFSNKRSFEGDFSAIVKELLRNGVEETEIFEGLKSFEEGFDAAEYGINKIYMVSKKLIA